jgi:hypothetical protein
MSMPVANRCPHQAARGAEAKRLRAFIERASFPCVAAKAVLRQGGLRMIELGPLGDAGNASPLLDALTRLAPVLDAVGSSSCTRSMSPVARPGPKASVTIPTPATSPSAWPDIRSS